MAISDQAQTYGSKECYSTLTWLLGIIMGQGDVVANPFNVALPEPQHKAPSAPVYRHRLRRCRR